MRLHAGRSADGINWQLEHEPIHFECDEPEDRRTFAYGYDPRVVLDRGPLLRRPGATATTARPSAWPGRRTSRPSTSSRTRSCPSTATASCSRARSTATTLMLSRPQRQRPHAVRRHLLQREPGPDLLGQAPVRHGHRGRLAVHQGRRRPRADRDHRGLAADLPRRAHVLQRVRLQPRARRCSTWRSPGR